MTALVFAGFVGQIVSVFLRERGSPESKPVDAAHSETEEQRRICPRCSKSAWWGTPKQK